MGQRGAVRPRLGACVGATCWGLAALSAVILLQARPRVDGTLWFYLVDATVACVYGTVASTLLARRLHPVTWLVTLTGLGGAVAAVAFAGEAWWVRTHADGRDSLPVALDLLNATAWVPGTLALFLVVPWLVRDHAPGVGARAGAAGGALIAVATTVGGLLGLDLLVLVGLLACIPYGLVTAAAVQRRRRRGPVRERTGLGWLALGTTVMALSFVPVLLPVGPVWATPVLHLVAQTLFPAAILVAVLRGRMWDLDLVVSRTTVVGLVGVVLLVAYVSVVVVVGRVLPGEGVAPAVAAGTVALAVQPVRLWATRRVRVLVHGTAADPALAVRALGVELGRGTDDLLPDLARALAEALRLESVRVLDAAGAVLARHPDARDHALPLVGSGRGTEERPLLHRGVAVGTLRVVAPGGETLSGKDRQVLDELSGVLAAAVAVHRAGEEVVRLRGDLSQARLAERRLIRREIHDGLGPSLAGLRLGLQGVQNLLTRDPKAATALLEALQIEVDERVVAVRELSHHLLPPVLDELGLGAALSELGLRHASAGLQVEVDLDARSHDLPAVVATAAYGIVAEAVANVARHARATGCRVEVRERAGWLEVTVVDDGRGIGSDAVAGVGTHSMAERAESVGGRTRVGPASGGGTLVRAVLPVAGPQERDLVPSRPEVARG
ncbi:MAG: sensor histidine kinase [Nocardioides sp.]|uniref:sensor histidine kinase n=1 Tax=Nocardioides sp. TaxID=35761 RepID=UPI003F0C1BAE